MRYVIFVVSFFFLACNLQNEGNTKGDTISEIKSDSDIIETTPGWNIGYKSESGGNVKFKVPLSPEYNWEVAQSWAAHCKQCDEKYPFDTVKYCVDSHTGDCCKYAWDFNLEGNNDEHKPVLASASGKVQKVGKDVTGWGNYVVIDHGDNICTRYAHMYDDSITILAGQSVCQGFKIGEMGSTGNSKGPHLHFQFEDCKTGAGLEMGFDDGNEIPVCTKGKDVFDANGKYSALKLTNKEVTSCKEGPEDFSGGKMSYKGWVKAKCGGLNSCPLIPNCTRNSSYKFADDGKLDQAVSAAASYLYSECVLDGKSNGKLQANDLLTKAEALKIVLRLTGMTEQCGFKDVDFADVDEGEWYFPYIACAVKAGILDNMSSYFYPNKEVNLAEAAKLLVKTAHARKLIEMKNPSVGHFSDVSADHWAYQFLETLYDYGGIPPSLQNAKADTKVKRGEYIVMAASLSPCFCPNVVCESSCYCNQETFSCTDPNDNSSGTGGGSGGQKSSCFQCKESYKQAGMCNVYHNGCGGFANCGPCPNGEVCKVGQCEKVGSKSEPKKDPEPPKEQEPPKKTEPSKKEEPPKENCKTCSDLGASCGLYYNGCDKVMNCGSCSSGYECVGGMCKKKEPDPPKQNCFICKDSDKQSGMCNVYHNGCGGFTNCGPCPGGQECDYGKCKKTQTEPPKQPDPPKPPCKTCSQLEANCGTHYNGCGLNIYCGNCSSGYTCQSGQCKKNEPPPDPKPKNCQTCANTGYKCGMLYSNCGGGYLCGICPFGKLCKQGKCYDKK